VNYREVYAVSSGSYSDYQVLGIYSKREDAEAQAEKLCGVDGDWAHLSDRDARVEVFPMDFDLAGLGPRIVYGYVRMFHDGTLDRGRVILSRGSREPHQILGTRVRRAWWKHRGIGFVEVTIGQIDGHEGGLEERVVKTANEKRAQLIALDLWPKEGDEDVVEQLDKPASVDPKDERITALEERLAVRADELEAARREARRGR